MRKKEKSLLRHVLNWIFIYILVLAGSIIFTIIVTYVYNQSTIQIGLFDKQYYIDNQGEFNPNVILHKANNIVYDANGNQVAFYPTQDQTDDWDSFVHRVQSDLVDQQYVYKIGLNPSADTKFAVYVAMPMDDGGTFFFFKQPPFFNKVIIILLVVVSVLILMMGIYTYLLYAMGQRNLKMQRDYVDNITHELKSPIASVRALTETMYDGLIQEEEKRKRYYKIILNEINGLENTVSNMLELSKIQNGQIDATKSSISSYELFDTVLEKYAALCDERNIALSISPDHNSGCTLYTNQNLASRMLEILLDNAVKFADRDHGCIQILFDENSKEVIVSITDNGSGITPDDQKLIFSRFYKGDKSHNEKGSGLGLSIAQEIAGCLNEKLWLRSSGPEGTTFCFTIQKQSL